VPPDTSNATSRPAAIVLNDPGRFRKLIAMPAPGHGWDLFAVPMRAQSACHEIADDLHRFYAASATASALTSDLLRRTLIRRLWLIVASAEGQQLITAMSGGGKHGLGTAVWIETR